MGRGWGRFICSTIETEGTESLDEDVNHLDEEGDMIVAIDQRVSRPQRVRGSLLLQARLLRCVPGEILS